MFSDGKWTKKTQRLKLVRRLQTWAKCHNIEDIISHLLLAVLSIFGVSTYLILATIM